MYNITTFNLHKQNRDKWNCTSYTTHTTCTLSLSLPLSPSFLSHHLWSASCSPKTWRGRICPEDLARRDPLVRRSSRGIYQLCGEYQQPAKMKIQHFSTANQIIKGGQILNYDKDRIWFLRATYLHVEVCKVSGRTYVNKLMFLILRERERDRDNSRLYESDDWHCSLIICC